VTAAAIEPSVQRAVYSPALIALHWLTAATFVAIFATVEAHGYWPKGDPTRVFLMDMHKSLGLTILLLVLVRMFVRSRTIAPRITPPLATWQIASAHIVHTTLYAAMLSMPLLGWLMSDAAGRPVPFFAWELPAIIGENKDLGRTLRSIHEFIGSALYWVIGLHAFAALANHYVLRNNTLPRMLPFLRQRHDIRS